MSQAVVYNRQGGPEVLELIEVAEPSPAAHEVVVDVRAAGLNPFDFKLRSGIIPMPVEFPKGIGLEFAGVVSAVGADAKYFDGSPVRVGDEVLGWSEGGAMREHVLTGDGTLARKPPELSWEAAGSLTIASLTAMACIELMNPHAGDTVVVSAAAGAVGVIYCQLAIARGARVIGTASESNHDFLRSLGVEPVSHGAGLIDRLRELTPSGISLAQDNWGREFIDIALELGVPADRICTIVDHAATAELGLANPGRYERNPATLERLASDVAKGNLNLPIDRVFPLTEVRAAFELLETRHVRGKVVVIP